MSLPPCSSPRKTLTPGLLLTLCLPLGTLISTGQDFQVRGNVVLNGVPTGSQATRSGPVVTNLADLPYSVTLNNTEAGRSSNVTGGMAAMTNTVQTGNRANMPFLSGSANTTSVVMDRLTVTGSSWTGTIRIKIDFEITGSVTVNQARYNPSVSTPSFTAISDVEIRLNNNYRTRLEYNLRDELAAQGGPTPRVINGTFPISKTVSTQLTIYPGTSFTTEIRQGATVSFSGAASEGIPPELPETFRPVADFGGIQMQTQTRITKISFVPPAFETGSVVNPVITSLSGYNYNPLQNGLPSPNLRVLGVSRGTNSFTIQWDSSGGQPTFSAYASNDLTLPLAQWTRIAQSIPNAGATTSFTESNIGNIPRRFYRIESE